MNPQQPYILGIAGGTGSGKTTVAASVAAAIGPGRAAVINADTYYHDLSHLTMAERHRVNFDHPDALDFGLLCAHVRELASGRRVIRQAYDFCTHCLSGETIIIQPAQVVIIEGMLIFVPEDLLKLFSLKVFLDEAADVRLLRRIRRDMTERGRTFDSVQRQYIEQVRPMHELFVEPSRRHADIVIPPGEDCTEIVLRIVAAIGMNDVNS